MFLVPTINGQGGVDNITLGADGRFWYTYRDFNHRAKIGAMSMSGKASEYVVSQLSAWPSSITKGPDGNIWITDADGIARVTPSGQVSVFASESPKSAPDAIVSGPDGNLWFVDKGTNKIGRIKP